MTASGSLGLSPELWEDARLTLGGAIATAARLPEPLAGELAGSARDAFTQAFCTVEAVGAGMISALAVGAVLFLARASGRQPLEQPRERLELLVGVAVGEQLRDALEVGLAGAADELEPAGVRPTRKPRASSGQSTRSTSPRARGPGPAG